MDKRIQKYVDYYKKKFGLDEYTIVVVVASDYQFVANREVTTIRHKADYDGEVTVKLRHSKEYTIVLNRHTLHNDLKDTIKHEMLHILLWEVLASVESIIDLTPLEKEAKVKFFEDLDIKEHELLDKLMDII